MSDKTVAGAAREFVRLSKLLCAASSTNKTNGWVDYDKLSYDVYCAELDLNAAVDAEAEEA